MSVKLTSITLNTANLTQQIEFYKGLGFEVDAVKISKGSECYRVYSKPSQTGAVGAFEVKLFGMADKVNAATPILQLCFNIQNLDQVYSALSNIPGVITLLDPTDMADGRQAIVKDPDGNSVEITELRK